MKNEITIIGIGIGILIIFVLISGCVENTEKPQAEQTTIKIHCKDNTTKLLMPLDEKYSEILNESMRIINSENEYRECNKDMRKLLELIVRDEPIPGEYFVGNYLELTFADPINLPGELGGSAKRIIMLSGGKTGIFYIYDGKQWYANCPEIMRSESFFLEPECIKTRSKQLSKELVEKIILYNYGKEEVIDPKTDTGIEIANFLIQKLRSMDMQTISNFSEEKVHGMKQKDRIIEIVFSDQVAIPTPIIIPVPPGVWLEFYNVTIYNVTHALFILEDNLNESLKANIVVDTVCEGERRYECWAICKEGTYEINKSWIDEINEKFLSKFENETMNESINSKIEELFLQHNLRVMGDPEKLKIKIPMGNLSNLTGSEGAYWHHTKKACEEGGYSPEQFKGKEVLHLKYQSEEDENLTVNIFCSGNDIICAYKDLTDRKPGIVSINQTENRVINSTQNKSKIIRPEFEGNINFRIIEKSEDKSRDTNLYLYVSTDEYYTVCDNIFKHNVTIEDNVIKVILAEIEMGNLCYGTDAPVEFGKKLDLEGEYLLEFHSKSKIDKYKIKIFSRHILIEIIKSDFSRIYGAPENENLTSVKCRRDGSKCEYNCPGGSCFKPICNSPDCQLKINLPGDLSGSDQFNSKNSIYVGDLTVESAGTHTIEIKNTNTTNHTK